MGGRYDFRERDKSKRKKEIRKAAKIGGGAEGIRDLTLVFMENRKGENHGLISTTQRREKKKGR